MPLFGRGPDTRPLPRDIVEMMVSFGRYEVLKERSGIDSSAAWGIVSRLLPMSQSDRAGLVEGLNRVVTPVGGFAAYGASRTVAELLGLDFATPAEQSILDGAIAFLRENGVPPMRVRPYEWDRWLQTGGSIEAWLPVRAAPPPERPGITALGSTETRFIAKLTDEDESNLVFVGRDGADFVGIIDARYSDENPTRDRRVWHRAATLHQLYVAMGRSLQTPPHWASSELEPYIPLPRPRV